MKKDVYIPITESLCHTVEINTTSTTLHKTHFSKKNEHFTTFFQKCHRLKYEGTKTIKPPKKIQRKLIKQVTSNKMWNKKNAAGK